MFTTQKAFYITYIFLSIGLAFRIIGVSTNHWATGHMSEMGVYIEEWAGLFKACVHIPTPSVIRRDPVTTCSDLDSTQGDYVLGCQILACTATVWLALCLSFVLFSHWLTAVKQTPGKAVTVVTCAAVLVNVSDVTAIAAGIWYLSDRPGFETMSWSAVLYFCSDVFNFSTVGLMFYLRRCLRQLHL